VNATPALELASRQHGALADRQLRALGVSSRAQRRAVEQGVLIRVAPGAVVVGGSPDSWHRRLQVGLLVLGPGAFVSHEAAAALLGLDGTRAGAVVFTVPRQRRRHRLTGVDVHTTDSVGPHDVLTIQGFPCASATRTVVDLAASGAPPARVAAAIDSAIRLRLSAVPVLTERLAHVRGRRGVRMLDQLLLDSGGESILERTFLALVRQAGLPRPQTQHRVRADARHVARVDFVYPEHRVVVEVSGLLGHSNPADRDRDAQRRNELQDLGYRVYEYTWSHLTRRSAWVIATLQQRLARQSWARSSSGVDAGARQA
jgi:very-short-patch-repair endonuclease